MRISVQSVLKNELVTRKCYKEIISARCSPTYWSIQSAINVASFIPKCPVRFKLSLYIEERETVDRGGRQRGQTISCYRHASMSGRRGQAHCIVLASLVTWKPWQHAHVTTGSKEGGRRILYLKKKKLRMRSTDALSGSRRFKSLELEGWCSHDHQSSPGLTSGVTLKRWGVGGGHHQSGQLPFQTSN
uniref:Uncharacterized protein n=1 Tax=Biomphalaria glabrata TaxID=6526 RepID=A0A2C9KUQ9_BIOGL